MPMQLRYETTSADQLAKLDRYARDWVVSRRFLWFAYFAISGLAWLSAILYYVKQGDQSFGYLAYGAFALTLTLSLPWLYRWYQRSFWASVLNAAALRGLVGPKVLTIDDATVEEAGPVLTARASWKDVLRVDRDAERTFIFLAPLIAIVVPDRVFADVEVRKEFDQLIHRCMEEAANPRSIFSEVSKNDASGSDVR